MRFVYIGAEWCGICRGKAPLAQEVARDRELPLEALDIDTDRGRAEADRLRIRTVPTLALVDGDRVRFGLVGRMITREGISFLMDRL